MFKRGGELYLLAALLAATLLSPLPQSAIALALLLSGLYFQLKKLTRWRIPIVLGYFLIIPLLFEPVLHLFSPMIVIPILPLISSSLKENALSQSIASTAKQRDLTSTSKSVMATAGATILVSLLLGNWVLTITSGTALLLMAGILIYVLRSLPLPPLEIEQKELRVIAGNTASLSTKLENRAKIPLHVCVNSSYSWIHVAQGKLLNFSGEAGLKLNLAPSLSGPSQPQIEASSTDPWGLIQIRQAINPLRLYVIPRARYAEWLARKYLEETAPRGGAMAAMLSAQATADITPKRGVEYYTSRLYQPGDRLKDVDWKHTAKLHEIVVKEYTEDTRQTAIIAVNLTATDAEEADKLVYNLIASALTLARRTIPTAIAAYDQEQVLAATPPLNARELVKKALQLGQKVVLTAALERYIQPPDMRQLRISLRQLKETNMAAARNLRKILELERKAIEEGAKKHPARKALNRVTARTLLPATITVISPWSHDNEALWLTLEELRKKGYGSALINIKGASR